MQVRLKAKGAGGVKKLSVFGDDEDDDSGHRDCDNTPNSSANDLQLDKSDALREEGCRFAEDGRFIEAISTWQRALSITPTDHRLHELKAQGYLALDRVSEALSSAEKAVELQPLWVEGLQCLARCQREIGEVELSLQVYRKALTLEPSNEELCSEAMEVESLVGQLEMSRKIHFDRMNSSTTEEDAEAHRVWVVMSELCYSSYLKENTFNQLSRLRQQLLRESAKSINNKFPLSVRP
eukprot:gene24435-29535_t